MEADIYSKLIVQSFSRTIKSYNREAVAQRQIVHRMCDMLSQHLPPLCPHILEIGSGTGFLTRKIVENLRPERLVLNDICQDMSTCYTDLLGEQVTFLSGDAERLSFPKGQDLIVSCSALQWFVNPERFFERCNDLLKERGYFAFTTFGVENLKEISAVTGVGLQYRTLEELKQALAVHYEIITSSEERICLTFDTPLQVLYHLKHTGVTALKRQAWTKRDLHDFCHKYTHLFGEGESVTLTYHPIYIIARKKEQ